MFDTNIVIVGNVLTAPEWRRTTKTETLVANFRVASTSRKFDRENDRWVDGDSLRVRVNCWRKLAENVMASVAVGDPIVVVGRLYTRDWTDSENNPRISYEMEAVAVGHDLARGKTKLFRNRPALAASVAEGPEADGMVRGEAAFPVSDDEVPIGYGEGIPDDVDPPVFVEAPVAATDSVAALAGGGFEPFDTGVDASSDQRDEIEIGVEAMSEPAVESRPRRGSRRQPVPA